MEEKRKTIPRLRGLFVDTLVILLFHNVSSSQILVCSSSNISEPLSCSSQQWVRIQAEIYAPQTETNGTSCQEEILSNCNTYFHDTGMQVNCNGPAWRGGVACREEVDVDKARGVEKCLQNVPNVATLVQYDCIQESNVLNLCQASTTLTSDTFLYLASPGYPQSTPDGKMCTCTIQGSSLKMNAIEINVRSKLPWDGDSKHDGIYNSVFSVTSGRTQLWRSNECAACTTSSLVNTNLFLPVDDIKYQNVTITYSDFGLTGQIVWVEVFDLGSSMNISCSSLALPSDRIITSTTTATAHTAASYTTNPHDVTTRATNPIVTVTSQTLKTFTTTDVKTATSTPLLPASAPSTTAAGKDKSGTIDPVVLTVTLIVLLLVLVVTAVAMGVIVYRKRHLFKSDGYISPWVLLQSWCHRIFHQKQYEDPDSCNHDNFDAVVMHNELYPRAHDLHVVNKDETAQASRDVCTIQAKHNLHSVKTHHDEINSIDSPTNNGETLIPPHLYESHQQMLDQELDKMRRDRNVKACSINNSKNSMQKVNNDSNVEADITVDDKTGETSQV